MIPNKELHKRKQVKIPMPELYVLYGGKELQPSEETLNLSDAFIDEIADVIPLEVIVKVININHNAKHDVLEKSIHLREYSYFVHLVNHYKNEGKSLDEALRLMMEISNKRGVLSEFLKKYGSEVFNMLEWRIEDALEARWEEGAEDKAITIAKNLLQAKIPVAEVAKHVQMPLEIIEKL